MRTSILLAATALALSACATATPYQAAGNNSRGFAEQQIEQNRFRVSFSGNSLTDLDTVENYLLYRAAELTAQRGFDHFIISDRATESKDRYIGGSSFGGGYGHNYHARSYFGWSYFRPSYGWGYGYGYDPFFDSLDMRQITRYQASAEIVMGKGAKPADNDRAYDAREVMINLAGSIIRPEA
ncbi:MAG: hypothetical protein COA47_12320 [Robiginitomaculum sp.]|nr:MAG: hypothetical protein COA47_12320 [Robiginitomaculum sp.]